MKTDTQTTFTPLETRALDALMPLLYAEEGFSDCDSTDLAAASGIDPVTLSGVIGSLCKKGVITSDDDPDFPYIYLRPEFYHLHPTWDTANIWG